MQHAALEFISGRALARVDFFVAEVAIRDSERIARVTVKADLALLRVRDSRPGPRTCRRDRPR